MGLYRLGLELKEVCYRLAVPGFIFTGGPESQ